MQNLVIITGGTGYIGKNLQKYLKIKKIDFVITKRTSSGYSYFDSDENQVDKTIFENKELIVVHLATYFSKDSLENSKIVTSNETFGKIIFKELKNFYLKKFIYTNTMYSFYPDKEIRNLEYTLSKNRFAEFIYNQTKLHSILFEEIYLDNTFGFMDNRPKVMPAVFSAVASNEKNPIKNKDVFINLIYLQDVLDRLFISICEKNSERSSFISYEMVNITSIYEYLNTYKNSSKMNTNLLIYNKNNYIEDYPKIDYKGLKISKLENMLVEELKKYESK